MAPRDGGEKCSFKQEKARSLKNSGYGLWGVLIVFAVSQFGRNQTL